MANDEQLDPVEQVFLHAYPNPDRIDCPGDAVVRAIGQKKLPLDHPAREHIAKCSPCYADFKRFLREDQKQAARIRALGGIAALLVLGGISWVWLSSDAVDSGLKSTPSAKAPFPQVLRPRQPTDDAPKVAPSADSGTTVAVLNLEGLSRSRGVNDEQAVPELQRLPRKSRVSLSIYLPLGSDEGQYEIRLLRNARQLDQPLRTYQGAAKIQTGLTVLPIAADFSGLEPGTYVLAFRRGNESWHFGRVALD